MCAECSSPSSHQFWFIFLHKLFSFVSLWLCVFISLLFDLTYGFCVHFFPLSLPSCNTRAWWCLRILFLSLHVTGNYNQLNQFPALDETRSTCTIGWTSSRRPKVNVMENDCYVFVIKKRLFIVWGASVCKRTSWTARIYVRLHYMRRQFRMLSSTVTCVATLHSIYFPMCVLLWLIRSAVHSTHA